MFRLLSTHRQRSRQTTWIQCLDTFLGNVYQYLGKPGKEKVGPGQVFVFFLMGSLTFRESGIHSFTKTGERKLKVKGEKYVIEDLCV